MLFINAYIDRISGLISSIRQPVETGWVVSIVEKLTNTTSIGQDRLLLLRFVSSSLGAGVQGYDYSSMYDRNNPIRQ